jgi:hypothetical protein
MYATGALIYFNTISTRRFLARPTSVSAVDAIGARLATPYALIHALAIPNSLDSASATDCALRFERSRFDFNDPLLMIRSI